MMALEMLCVLSWWSSTVVVAQKTSQLVPSVLESSGIYMEAVTTTEVLFVHVPKTGGETIEAALRVNKNHSSAFGRNHCKPALERMHKAPGTIWFTVVRDPYTRLVSWFKFCVHGWHRGIPTPYHINLCDEVDAWAEKSNDQAPSIGSIKIFFNHWLLKTKAAYDFEMAEHGLETCRAKFESGFVWGTYESWLKDQQGGLLVDVVIKFEDLFNNNFNRTIADVLLHASGVRLPKGHAAYSPLTHMNDESAASSRHPFLSAQINAAAAGLERSWYDNQTRAVVNKHFGADMQWLSYQQGT
mmetsp:Transcript_4365/g.9250  ORF Transcript_4365/g.9250 Transcript_4365/m.9250 type:complete len:299 (-) Transcript_4365:160-1056(-)